MQTLTFFGLNPISGIVAPVGSFEKLYELLPTFNLTEDYVFILSFNLVHNLQMGQNRKKRRTQKSNSSNDRITFCLKVLASQIKKNCKTIFSN